MHVMMHDLEACSPDWIIGWRTSEALLQSLYATYDFIPPLSDPKQVAQQIAQAQPGPSPGQSKYQSPPTRTPKGNDFVLRHQWSAVKILEEYNHKETRVHTRPYAFVADCVVRVELDVDVNEEMGTMGKKMLEEDGHAWFEQLNEKLQPEEAIKWYIVVCSDELRSIGPQNDADSGDQQTSGEELSRPSSNGSTVPAGEREARQKKKWSTSVREKVREKSSLRTLFKKKTEQENSEQAGRPGQ